MKTVPLSFSAALIPLVLNGQKTQTRRIVKPRPHEKDGTIFWMTAKDTHMRIYDAHTTREKAFAHLWDSIYSKDPAHCWDANPWVTAVTWAAEESV